MTALNTNNEHRRELIIQGSKWVFVIGLLACLGLVVATIPFYKLMDTGPDPYDPLIMFKILDVVLLVLAAYFGINLILPYSKCLRLSKNGFERCGLLQRKFYKWADVSNFRVVSQTSQARLGSLDGQMVAFDFLNDDATIPDVIHGNISTQDWQRILEGYKVKPNELAKLMTEWKIQADSPTDSI